LTALIFISLLALAFLLLILVKFLELSGFSKIDAFAILLVSPLTAFLPPVKFAEFGEMGIYLSISGFIIPFLVCIRQFSSGKVSLKKALPGIAILTAISYLISHPESDGVGVSHPLLPVLVAVIYSMLVERDSSFSSGSSSCPSCLAYVCATLGMFLGADVLHLSSMERLTSSVTIGGAGIFDAVYMSGFIAVLFDSMLISIRKLLKRGREN